MMAGARSLAFAAASAVAAGACHSSLPEPAPALQPSNAYVEVPYPPPAALVETVPRRPSEGALWIDGQWSWDGQHWVWNSGGWVAPPPGGRFARWQLRLEPDGRMKFAGPSWRDASGRELPPARVLAAARGETASQTLPVRCR
jgi:hypothetical protein